MAARSALVAMLLAIPVFAVLLIGFSGGVGGLSFGISSLASGPTVESVAQGTPPADLSGLIDASAGAAGSPAPGTTITAPPGTAPPPTVNPLPPTAVPLAGDTRQPIGDPGGGDAAPAPPTEGIIPGAPSPGDPAADPTAPVNGAVDAVGGVIDDLLGSPR